MEIDRRGGDVDQEGPTPMIWQLRIRRDIFTMEVPPEERSQLHTKLLIQGH